MTTNHDNLKLIYRKISVLEMVEKLKGCAIDWVQVSPAQFQATVQQDGDVWDLNLLKNISSNLIVMDFRRNGFYFYSIDSNEDGNLITMYREIEGDEDFRKDRELLRDVSGFEGCS